MTAQIHERVESLEAAAFRTGQHFDTINATLTGLTDKASNHGRALSSTMQDLAQLRQDVTAVIETQAAHTEALQQIQATLTELTTLLRPE